jgi:Neuraminidase (sialidase)
MLTHRAVFALFVLGALASYPVLVAEGGETAAATENPVETALVLAPSADNPRNSEGDFIALEDGRVLFVYTHFTDGAGDHAAAHLAARVSEDGGRTWSEKSRVVVPNDGGFNVMSVSLVRLKDGRIALFYLRKNSTQDCRPLVRFSDDEAQSWSEPTEVISSSSAGYYVMNNDRVIQMKVGRLVAPVAQHYGAGQPKWTGAGIILCYLSDDGGRTWIRGEAAPVAKDSEKVVLQEPGVVELKDGSLMIFCRTNAGSQFVGHSKDGGRTWSPLEPSAIVSPVSPASIERIPSTGELLLVWNDHDGIPPELRGKRTPLTVAVSADEGRTWQHKRVLFDNPHGWYCYTAIEFVGNRVLLGHCAGDRRQNNGLAETHVTRFPVAWLGGECRGFRVQGSGFRLQERRYISEFQMQKPFFPPSAVSEP